MDTPDSRLTFWGMTKLLARPMKYQIAKALSAQITAQLCQLGQAFALAWIVRALLKFYYYSPNTGEKLDLSFGVICFVGFSIVELVSRYLSGTFVSALQSKIKTLILDKSFSKLMTHSNDYFTSRSTGKITSNVSGLPKEMNNLVDMASDFTARLYVYRYIANRAKCAVKRLAICSMSLSANSPHAKPQKSNTSVCVWAKSLMSGIGRT